MKVSDSWEDSDVNCEICGSANTLQKVIVNRVYCRRCGFQHVIDDLADR